MPRLVLVGRRGQDSTHRLEILLCLSQALVVLELVEMGEHTQDLWESMSLQDVQKFECLHFEPKASYITKTSIKKLSVPLNSHNQASFLSHTINQEEDQISRFGEIHHGIQIVEALNEGQTTGLARNDGNRSPNLR